MTTAAVDALRADHEAFATLAATLTDDEWAAPSACAGWTVRDVLMEGSRVVGPEGIKQAVKLFRRAFPDLTYTVEEEMAERDLVWTRFSARGTHKGEFLGAPPTGRTVTYAGMDLNRIKAGKIVESWVNYDALALLQQVGLVPAVKGM